MTGGSSVTRRFLIIAPPVLGIAACAGPASGPSFYDRLDLKPQPVDQAAALSLVNGFRLNEGLPPLSLSPKLSALSKEQADAMAAADKLSHNIGGRLPKRLDKGGYAWLATAENIGAGYRTLAEAFSGWRDSPPHRKNMLNDKVTEMGIAATSRPDGKYRVFWAMILARPDA